MITTIVLRGLRTTTTITVSGSTSTISRTTQITQFGSEMSDIHIWAKSPVAIGNERQRVVATFLGRESSNIGPTWFSKEQSLNQQETANPFLTSTCFSPLSSEMGSDQLERASCLLITNFKPFRPSLKVVASSSAGPSEASISNLEDVNPDCL